MRFSLACLGRFRTAFCTGLLASALFASPLHARMPDLQAKRPAVTDRDEAAAEDSPSPAKSPSPKPKATPRKKKKANATPSPSKTPKAHASAAKSDEDSAEPTASPSAKPAKRKSPVDEESPAPKKPAKNATGDEDSTPAVKSKTGVAKNDETPAASLKTKKKKKSGANEAASESPKKKANHSKAKGTKKSAKKKATPEPEKTPKPEKSPSPKPSPSAAVAIEQPTSPPPPRAIPTSTPGPDAALPPADITVQKSGLQEDQGYEPPPPPPPRRGFWSSLFGRKTAPPANYRYLSRSVIEAIRNAPVQRGRWKFIVVHNSGTRQGNARAFDYYHRHVRRMQNGLAYHFVIGNGTSSDDGQVEIGDRWRRQINGGHVHSDYLNNIALGICLVGDFNRDQPSRAQLDACEELIRYLRTRCGKADGRDIPVRPHREVNPPRWATDCPGDSFPYVWFRRF
ncbi:MAG: N-acetylmuramoyl-L-alanine amidase [Chthoniobacterales bacterium]